MKCAEVRKLLPGMALGDVDAEVARAAGEHAAGCEACRAERVSIDATVAALGSADVVAPSSERRQAAVAAMAQARADEVERLLLRPRRPWIAIGSIAAVLLVSVAAFLFVSPAGVEFRVAEVLGRADLYRPDEERCVTLKQGDVVRSGDRVITQGRARVRLDLSPGTLFVDQYTSIAITRSGRIVLDSGRLYAEMKDPAVRPLVITDTANNSISLREGRMEAATRPVTYLVGSSREDRHGKADVPAPREEVSRRLVARVVEGAVDLGGAHDQRLRATAGEEGTFDLNGQPATSPMGDVEVAPWRKPRTGGRTEGDGGGGGGD